MCVSDQYLCQRLEILQDCVVYGKMQALSNAKQCSLLGQSDSVTYGKQHDAYSGGWIEWWSSDNLTFIIKQLYSKILCDTGGYTGNLLVYRFFKWSSGITFLNALKSKI